METEGSRKEAQGPGDGDKPGEPPPDAQELTLFVQSVMEQMQTRFGQMSSAIIGRVDEMSSRIDELEKSIQDLMVQAEIDAPEDADEPAPSAGAGAAAERAGAGAVAGAVDERDRPPGDAADG